MATVKKLKKAQSGERLQGVGKRAAPAHTVNYSVDTTGYAAGKKKFPATMKTTVGKKTKRELPDSEGNVSRRMVKDFIKGKTYNLPSARMKKGGKLKKSK